jgi:predicted transcriptional regulator
MDILFEKGESPVSEVQDLLPERRSYSTVRALLSILEKKGYIKHKEIKQRYVYYPTLTQDKAQKSALKHLMQTFFENSTERVVAALILSAEDADKLKELIDKARMEGR